MENITKQCEIHQLKLEILCLQKGCKSKIGCVKCIYEFHQAHLKKIYFLEDIQQAKTNDDVPFWCEKKLQIANTSNQQSYNELEQKFDEFESTIMQVFYSKKQQLNKIAVDIKENSSAELQTLVEMYKTVFNPEPILEALNSDTQEQFQRKILEYISNKDRKNLLENLQVAFKNHSKIQISKEKFEQITKAITKSISELSSAWKYSDKWEFKICSKNFNNINNIKEIERGKTYEFTNLAIQTLVGDTNFIPPNVYKFDLIIDNIPENNYNCVYFGLIGEKQREVIHTSMTSQPCMYFDLINSTVVALQPKKLPLNNVIRKNIQNKVPTILKFEVNLDKQVIKIWDSNDETRYKIHLKRNLTQSANIHAFGTIPLNITPTTKLRPFLSSYNCICRISLKFDES